LSQFDVEHFDIKKDSKKNSNVEHEKLSKEVEFSSHLIDYTPPNFITLLFTDLGTFTPSAVSDELIKLYY
jgi:translation initiation factor eIF-2B subunit alpha